MDDATPTLCLFASLIASLIAALALCTFGPSASAHAQAVSAGAGPPPGDAGRPVNAVLGDTSFIATFGRRPTARDGEDLRLRTHLRYVEQRLRSKDTAHLSPKLRAARKKNLDRLHEYWQRGVFPRNVERPYRTPVFIDGAGRICAAGYLVEQALGRETAEEIDRAHHLDSVFEMTDSEALTGWLASSGLTLREVATIQPEYGPSFSLLFDFQTAGATACGTNENPDATTTGVAEPTAMLRGAALSCTAAIDDAFGSSGFDASFSEDRMLTFEINPHGPFHPPQMSFTVSRSPNGPQEGRLVFSREDEDTLLVAVTFAIPESPTSFDLLDIADYGPLLDRWDNEPGYYAAPDSVTMGFQARFQDAADVDSAGRVTLTQIDVGGRLLPVELASFEGVADGRAAQLRWRTASETNNAGFAVQQRPDGTAEWTRIGYVEGAGTTSEPQRYTFRTEALAPGTHAFRLKQVDYDGAFEYSDVVEVAFVPGEAFTLRAAGPNPFHAQTQVALTMRRPQDVRVAVYDALGRRVALLHDGALSADAPHRFTLDGSRLASGLYLVRAIGDAGFTATRSVTLVR